MVEQIAVLAGDDDVLVAEHHAFWLSGRAGRIQHDADIRPATAIDLGLPTCGHIGAGTQFRAAGVAHLVVRMQQRSVVFQKAPRIVVNDGAQRRHTIGDRQQLVDLLLIFDDGHRHLGMRQHEHQLFRDRILVNWNRNRAERLRGGESPIKPRTIVAEQRNRIVALQPKRAEPQRENANFLKNISPGMGLPDAEILLTHSCAIRKLHGITQKQLRHRIAVGRRCTKMRARLLRLGHRPNPSQTAIARVVLFSLQTS